jgi:hypothetical protein
MKLYPSMLKWAFALFVVLCTSLYTMLAAASGPVVTRYFSGVWEQTEQESQGLFLQIVEQSDGSKDGAAYWYTYGEDLTSAWYVGVGPVEGNQVLLKLYTAFGVDFMQPDSPVDATVEEIGTMVLTFQNCNKGSAVFETNQDDLGSGEFPIRRLTKLYHSRCSGGISDDTPSDVKPVILHVKLLPARDDIGGKAMAKFKEQADRSEFSVEAEDVPDGFYQLEVCGENEGEMTVAGGEGELAFRSPEEEGTPLLIFEPRDCLIELLDLDGVALSTGDAVLGDKQTGQGDDHPGNGHGHDNFSIEMDLDNASVYPDGSAEAELKSRGDHIEFEVEIEDVPTGLYALFVEGVEVGQIEVVDVDGDISGELEFRDPEEPGTALLDFNPRGKNIEIFEGATLIFDGVFPSA